MSNSLNESSNSIVDEDNLTTNLNPPFDVDHSIEIYREGNYVRLGNGITFYQLFEPFADTTSNKIVPRLIKTLDERTSKKNKIVLCLHGLVWWSISYHRLVQSMIDQGFTVLLFDFYGRGRSESPDIQYTLDALLTQTIELLEYLHIENLHLVGYSMGGAVATHFTATHPQRIIKLCLLGPAIIPVPLPFIAKLIIMPYIGKLLFKMAGVKSLLNRLETERFSSDIHNPNSIDSKVIDDLVAKVKWQILEKPGYLDSFHSTLYNIPFSNGLLHLLPLIPNNLPVLIILGRYDIVIPFSGQIHLKNNLPHARIEVIDCGHAFTVESPQETASLISEFLSQ